MLFVKPVTAYGRAADRVKREIVVFQALPCRFGITKVRQRMLMADTLNQQSGSALVRLRPFGSLAGLCQMLKAERGGCIPPVVQAPLQLLKLHVLAALFLDDAIFCFKELSKSRCFSCPRTSNNNYVFGC